MTDIYLDENLSPVVAQSLNLLNKGYFPNYIVYSTIEKFDRGAADEIIIPGIGQGDGILITRDFSIQKTRLQYDLCKKFNLGVFFLRLPKNQNKHWEIVRLLINHWEEIVEKIGTRKKPFAFRISIRGKMGQL
jgi:hypothetical protein